MGVIGTYVTSFVPWSYRYLSSLSQFHFVTVLTFLSSLQFYSLFSQTVSCVVSWRCVPILRHVASCYTYFLISKSSSAFNPIVCGFPGFLLLLTRKSCATCEQTSPDEQYSPDWLTAKGPYGAILSDYPQFILCILYTSYNAYINLWVRRKLSFDDNIVVDLYSLQSCLYF